MQLSIPSEEQLPAYGSEGVSATAKDWRISRNNSVILQPVVEVNSERPSTTERTPETPARRTVKFTESDAKPASQVHISPSFAAQDSRRSGDSFFVTETSEFSQDRGIAEKSPVRKALARSSIAEAINFGKVLTNYDVTAQASVTVRALEKTNKQAQGRKMEWKRSVVRKGSRLLLVASIIYGVARCVDLITRATAKGGCSMWPEDEADEKTLFAGLIVEGIWWKVIYWLCLWGMHRPNIIAYYFLLGLIFAYIICFPLLPSEPTCEDQWVKMLEKCQFSDQVWMNSCGPQGLTSAELMMVIICMSPYIVPQFKPMCVFVLLLLVAYLATSLTYMYTLEKVFHTELDIAVCVVLLFVASVLSAYRKFTNSRRQKYMRLLAHRKEEASEKLLDLLQDYLPDHVITPMLRSPNRAIAEQIPKASVLFLVISDFEEHLRRRSPEQLLDFLNTVFARIDRVCVDAKVTKIETVGEEYVAAVGVQPDDYEESKNEHDIVLSRLIVAALAIFKIQDEQEFRHDVDNPLSGVRFRMGIHTGPVVAGVIGQKLPRFRLFGDTVNTAARMMQKGLNGELQFGEETKTCMPTWACFASRGQVEMKGKGMVDVYLLNRGTGCEENAWEQHRSYALRKSKRNSLSNVIAQTFSEKGSSEKSLRQAKTWQTFDEMASGITQQVRTLQTFVKTLCCHGPGDRHHTAWLKEFYHARIASRIGPESDRQAILMILNTAAEALVAEFLEVGNTAALRLWVFLAFRLFFFVTIVVWRFAAHDKVWINTNPRWVELCRLIHVSVQTMLQMFSYALLVKPEVDDMMGESMGSDEMSGMDMSDVKAEAHKENLRVPIWQLLFLFWYAVTVMDLRLRLKPTVAFVVISLLALLLLPFVMPTVKQLAVTINLLGMMVTGAVGIQIAFVDQTQDKRRFLMETAVASAQQRMDSILNMLMPPLVALELNRRPSRSIVRQRQQASHYYKRATIACSDLVGFTKIASTRTPAAVVEMVSDLFGRFDELTNKYNIYKIETVGDAYIAGQAVKPLTSVYRPMSVVLFGFEMILEVERWSELKGVPVDCRVGLHTGNCVGGVVGIEMKRYHLFGQLLSAVELLESTAPEGRVHMSRACQEAVAAQVSSEGLSEDILSYVERTDAVMRKMTGEDSEQKEVLLTSKGEPVAYEDVGGGPTFVVESCRPNLYDPEPAGYLEENDRASTTSRSLGSAVGGNTPNSQAEDSESTIGI
jgi:class 3 adenylate cyclase